MVPDWFESNMSIIILQASSLNLLQFPLTRAIWSSKELIWPDLSLSTAMNQSDILVSGGDNGECDGGPTWGFWPFGCELPLDDSLFPEFQMNLVYIQDKALCIFHIFVALMLSGHLNSKPSLKTPPLVWRPISLVDSNLCTTLGFTTKDVQAQIVNCLPGKTFTDNFSAIHLPSLVPTIMEIRWEINFAPLVSLVVIPMEIQDLTVNQKKMIHDCMSL